MRPQSVRGPIPWGDLRWWALRRYRAVWAEGTVALGPWRFELPARCGARCTSETMIEISDGTLTVRIAVVDSAAPRQAPEDALRWAREGVVGAMWTTGASPSTNFEHELAADGAPRLRVRGTSANPPDRHWVTALVQSVTVTYRAT